MVLKYYSITKYHDIVIIIKHTLLIIIVPQFITIYLKILIWMVPTNKMQLLTSVLAYIMASWPPLSHKKFN